MIHMVFLEKTSIGMLTHTPTHTHTRDLYLSRQLRETLSAGATWLNFSHNFMRTLIKSQYISEEFYHSTSLF